LKFSDYKIRKNEVFGLHNPEKFVTHFSPFNKRKTPFQIMKSENFKGFFGGKKIERVSIPYGGKSKSHNFLI